MMSIQNLVPDTDTKYPFETASRLVLDALKAIRR